jgi:DNA-binding beta-propeller fold protein YncE
MSDRRYLLSIALSGLICAASCSPQAPRTGVIPDGAMISTKASSADKGPFLYVAGLELSKYQLGSQQPLQTVTLSGQAVGLALDRFGSLFVVEDLGSGAQIQVYSGRDLALLRTIGNMGGSYGSGIAADSEGYFYVTSGDGIRVFGPGGRPIYLIRRGGDTLAFDGSGNFYAGEPHDVALYTPTQQPGHLKFSRAISKGVRWPDALALGTSGDLFVANCLSCIYSSPPGPDSVTEYPPGSSVPNLRITHGIKGPQAVAVDVHGELYVANATPARCCPFPPGWVSVYPSGGSRPVRRITEKVDAPVALALDPSQNLYVADLGSGSVSVYSSDGAKLLYQIKQGIKGVGTLAIGSP